MATATFTNPTTAGNLLVACATYYKPTEFSSITDSAGGGFGGSDGNTWATAVAEVQGTDLGAQQKYAKNIANAGSSHAVRLTLTASDYPDIVAYELTGADTSAPLGPTDSKTDASGTSHTGNSVTATAAGLAISHGTDDSLNSPTFSMTSPWTQDQEQDHTGSFVGIVAGSQTVANGSNYNFAFSTNSSQPTIGMMSLYKVSAGGGSTQSFTTVVGNLTLTGETEQKADAYGGVQGNLTLTGETLQKADAFGSLQGNLTLTGETLQKVDAYAVTQGNLTLTGEILGMQVGLAFTCVVGNLTLSSVAAQKVDAMLQAKGSLQFTGEVVTLSTGTSNFTVLVANIHLYGEVVGVVILPNPASWQPNVPATGLWISNTDPGPPPWAYN